MCSSLWKKLMCLVLFLAFCTALLPAAEVGDVRVPPRAQAKPKYKATLAFVPLDNRPVCAAYPVAVLEAAGYEVLVPPFELLASRTQPADCQLLWKWLGKAAKKADAAVVSTDALLYGGLVASRTHHYSRDELSLRVSGLEQLELQRDLPVYGFSTFMRTPARSYGNVEPAYYSEIGPAIYKYSQLTDKIDSRGADYRDELINGALERNLEREPLEDWLVRRDKNMEVNKQLTLLARRGKFHYFAIGKDDNAPLSHTHMEARHMAMANMTAKDSDFQILPGVDQLGLLLLTRAVMELEHRTPSVYLHYVEGVGAQTIPQYSDQKLERSVPEQVIALGGRVTTDMQSADLILALNTPPDGRTQDSTATSNMFFASPANKRYIAELRWLLDAGRNISLADVSYSNGADNGFMKEMCLQGLLPRLSAYNGWNTADNTIGFALAQGVLAPQISKEDQLNLMRVRVIDDWFYQANARRHITAELEKAHLDPVKYQLGGHYKQIAKQATDLCRDLAFKYDLTKRTSFTLTFPWDRLFEVDILDMQTRVPRSTRTATTEKE